jgi:hypothetical protein
MASTERHPGKERLRDIGAVTALLGMLALIGNGVDRVLGK